MFKHNRNRLESMIVTMMLLQITNFGSQFRWFNLHRNVWIKRSRIPTFPFHFIHFIVIRQHSSTKHIIFEYNAENVAVFSNLPNSIHASVWPDFSVPVAFVCSEIYFSEIETIFNSLLTVSSASEEQILQNTYS